MVHKIKPQKQRLNPKTAWVAPYDREGYAAVFLHAHKEDGDHSLCGPVLFDSQRALRLYRQADPAHCEKIVTAPLEDPAHLAGWFDHKLPCMYFVCAGEGESLHLFRLGPEEAKAYLLGQTPRDRYNLEENRVTFPLDLSKLPSQGA
jgi:hypothetical protein